MRSPGPAPTRVSAPGDPGWYDSGPPGGSPLREKREENKKNPPKPVAVGALAGSDWQNSGPPRPEHEAFQKAQGGLPKSMLDPEKADKLPAAEGFKRCEWPGCDYVGKAKKDLETHIMGEHEVPEKVKESRKNFGKVGAASMRSKAKKITWNGKTQTINEWAEETGIHKQTLRQRLKNGWTEEKALTTPPNPARRTGVTARG